MHWAVDGMGLAGMYSHFVGFGPPSQTGKASLWEAIIEVEASDVQWRSSLLRPALAFGHGSVQTTDEEQGPGISLLAPLAEVFSGPMKKAFVGVARVTVPCWAWSVPSDLSLLLFPTTLRRSRHPSKREQRCTKDDLNASRVDQNN